MTPEKRIAMLENVLMVVAGHPIDQRLSAQSWRLIFQDMQQLCHTAVVQSDFDLEAYEPDEDWKGIAPVRLAAHVQN